MRKGIKKDQYQMEVLKLEKINRPCPKRPNRLLGPQKLLHVLRRNRGLTPLV